jgi:hypothetical protein
VKKRVEILNWSEPDARGLVKSLGPKGRAEVGAELLRALEANGHAELLEEADYASPYRWAERDPALPAPYGGPLPNGFWAAVAFAVPGANEGHYVHAGVLENGVFYEVLLIKTFGGWAHANALVAALNEALDA